ncbi:MULTISPECIES: tyrosine-type recombinase/integrase [Desulfovibrio]|uniref:tyrosine-type recombinase/integrase n=1 Tax=Desulfovibrio TaxID=872 RepID=UPI0026F170E0|nr:site-specific integrase [Desulfovibrio piger]
MVAKDENRSQDGRKRLVRRSTRYQGVQVRESPERRHRGKPDLCFTIDYRDAQGKRIRRDIGWASEGITAAFAHQERLRLIAEAKAIRRGESSPLTVQQASLILDRAWERYRDDWMKAKGKRYDSDQWMYDAHVRPVFGRTLLQEISPYALDRFMASLTAQGLSAQTIRHLVGLIRRIMRRMVAWGLYDGPLPFDAISMPRLDNRRERFLQPEEARALLAELHRRSHQTWLMALISLQCGLRFSEIAGIRHMDINIQQGLLYIAESKNGRARHAYLTPELIDALRDLPARPADALVFPTRNGERMTNVSDSFSRAVDYLGLNDTGDTFRDANGIEHPVKITDRRQRIVFHSLRHTYASWLACSGAGQAMIAELLGHSSLEMSRRYTHLMDDEKKSTMERISKIFNRADDEKR